MKDGMQRIKKRAIFMREIRRFQMTHLTKSSELEKIAAYIPKC